MKFLGLLAGISTHMNVGNGSQDSNEYSEEKYVNFYKKVNENISTKKVVV